METKVETFWMTIGNTLDKLQRRVELNERAEAETKTSGQTLSLVQDVFRVEFWLG
jgi:hypothetical protein